MAGRHLDLGRIEEALQSLAAVVPSIHDELGTPHDLLDAEVIQNMLAGYTLVERLVIEGIDMFAMGQHRHMLELNRIALCGEHESTEYAGHVEATERRFYEERYAGVEDVVGWYREREHRSVWDRAAGVYTRMLSEPQLFIEGNQRTGALLMSYVLMRGGEAPLVLNAFNAAEYFRTSAAICGIRKNSLTALVRFPGIQWRLSRFLRRERDTRYLLPPRVPAGTCAAYSAALHSGQQ